jgi:hypothetical protein
MTVELLRAIAQLLWPLTIILALVLYRGEIRRLAGRLRKGKFLGQELELEKETRNVDQQVEAAEKSEPAKPLADPAKDRVLQLAELQAGSDKVRRFLEEAVQDKPLPFYESGSKWKTNCALWSRPVVYSSLFLDLTLFSTLQFLLSRG